MFERVAVICYQVPLELLQKLSAVGQIETYKNRQPKLWDRERELPCTHYQSHHFHTLDSTPSPISLYLPFANYCPYREPCSCVKSVVHCAVSGVRVIIRFHSFHLPPPLRTYFILLTVSQSVRQPLLKEFDKV